VGECSCVSVHGANRLGTNSLLDLLVFGRAAGNHIVDFASKTKSHKPLPADAADYTLSRLNKLEGRGGEYAQDVANICGPRCSNTLACSAPKHPWTKACKRSRPSASASMPSA